MARDAAVWFVMIDGQQTGPMSRVELGLEFATGAISGQNFVWKEGMNGWLRGEEVPELAALFSGTPEPSAPPPPPKGVAVVATSRAKQGAPRKGKPPPKGAARPPGKAAASAGPPQKDVGKGMQEFDTGHFKLADLAADDNGVAKVSEFDTGHFRLADVKSGPQPPQGDWSKLTLQHDVKTFQHGVKGYGDGKPVGQAPAPAPAPAPTPAPAQDDWAKLTLQKDVRTFQHGVQGYADAKGGAQPAPVRQTPPPQPKAHPSRPAQAKVTPHEPAKRASPRLPTHDAVAAAVEARRAKARGEKKKVGLVVVAIGGALLVLAALVLLLK